MNNKNNIGKQIYVSYAWKVEEQHKIVEQLEQACKERGITLLRDKNELKYKESIRDYMDKLSEGDAIILVLSEDYFKSVYCMYELCRVHQHSGFHKRIFPIVVSGTRFYKVTERTPYIRYWEKEQEAIKQDLNTIQTENMGSSSLAELKEYGENCRVIDDLLSILGNMNTLTEDIHVESDFEIILDLIQPVQQQDDSNKPKHHRQSDQQFRQKISENIQKILVKQTNLRDGLKAKVNEDNNIKLENLADHLCHLEIKTAINQNLYKVTKQCLSDLDFSSSTYQNTWEAAKEILGWLCLLVVKDEWVEDQEQKSLDSNSLSISVQVNTPTGIEVASARFRQFHPQLKAMAGKANLYSQDGILLPQLDSGWEQGLVLERILIEIWNKVFPEDVRTPLIDKLSGDDLDNLDETLETRDELKTHHHYIPIPEDQTIASKLLEKLPSITIIYLSSATNEATLRVENEGRFISIIREFLNMNASNGN